MKISSTPVKITKTGASIKGGNCPPYFGRIEGAAGEQRRTCRITACPPSFSKLLRPLWCKLTLFLLLLNFYEPWISSSNLFIICIHKCELKLHHFRTYFICIFLEFFWYSSGILWEFSIFNLQLFTLLKSADILHSKSQLIFYILKVSW